MKLHHALIGFVLLSFVYISVAVGTAMSENLVVDVMTLLPLFFILCSLSLLSFMVRYGRWCWLLRQVGSRTPLVAGALAYCAGFAFTMVPGKIGELIRIRYFARLGVPEDLVVSAFLLERLVDLFAVLAFALLLVSNPLTLAFALAFVAVVASAVLLLAYQSWFWRVLERRLTQFNFPRVVNVLRVLQAGFSGIRVWLRISVLARAFMLGLCAWGLLALGFVLLLDQTHILAAFWPSLALYPSAMLVGAASLLPGGVVSTEGTIAAQLISWGAAAEKAIFVAVVIRMATLWFAMLLGFLSVLVLERRYQHAAPAAAQAAGLIVK